MQDDPMNILPDLTPQLAHWREWQGRSEACVDLVSAAPLAGLAATLDRDEPDPVQGSDVPPLAHWLFFLPSARQSELGADGHPKRGGVLPPVPLPRRMWARGRLSFHHALQVGDEISRVSRVKSVDAKHGRSGTLVFVTVAHEISNARGVAIVEEHDLVYCEAFVRLNPFPEPARAPADPTFTREVKPDPVLLFRYSALTFNGHRIHYDRDFATTVEGYPGLVVHGPLIATYLVDALRRERPAASLKRFAFTALRPVFDGQSFHICGRDSGSSVWQLWARDDNGSVLMRAEAKVE